MNTEFNNEQFTALYTDGMENSYWNFARKKIILKFLKKNNLNDIIDIGCGRAIVTSYIYSAGIRIFGVDLGATTKIDNSNLVIYYKTDVFELPEEISLKVKTIALFDVIEHIPDSVGFIKKLSEKFPNASSIIVTVPARKELWTNFDDYNGHYRRYDRNMIKGEMKDSGFEMVSCKYFFHTLYLLIRLNNLLTKRRDVNFTPPKGILITGLHKFTGMLFYIESFITPGTLLGSSIICVSKRIP